VFLLVLALQLSATPPASLGCEATKTPRAQDRLLAAAAPNPRDVLTARRFLIQGWPSADLAGIPAAYALLQDSLGGSARAVLFWLMVSDSSDEISDPMSSDSDDVALRAGVAYAHFGYPRVPVEAFLNWKGATEEWRAARAAFWALAESDSFNTVSTARVTFVCRLARRVLENRGGDAAEVRLFGYLLALVKREASIRNRAARQLLELPEVAQANKMRLASHR
jgi:hypothetical protein